MLRRVIAHLMVGLAATTCGLVKDPSAGFPFAAPEAALGAPWVSYALTVQGNAGEVIQAVQVKATGSFHQRWAFDEDAGEFAPSANSSGNTCGGVHWYDGVLLSLAVGRT